MWKISSGILPTYTGWAETSLLVWDNLRSAAKNLSFFAGHLADWPCILTTIMDDSGILGQ